MLPLHLFFKPLNSFSPRNLSTNTRNSTLYFNNADTDKLKILEASKGKSGIYMWTNLTNNKKYVGSSVNLKRRFLEYYNTTRLLRESSMPINLALLKYGYSKFSLEILEYCDIKDIMIREKHYFDLFNPEYNILEFPGSPSKGKGWKHSEATIEKNDIGS